jgi:two-component system response regulator (stage 0 sporulation protein F)
MPGIDGIETLRRIKKSDKTISVIMLTAYGTPEVQKQALELGADSLMAKPFEVLEIKSVISDSLRGEREKKNRGRKSLSKTSHPVRS